ncbi:MAG: DUF5916 domain-containing protein [Lentimicrobiaceae bacterium]
MADDSIWRTIPSHSDFRQYQPVYDAEPSYRTDVKIAYDDYAIYVLAYMYDPNPDSILRQLGLRDEEYLNADMFSIEFDTYNNQLDAYGFKVAASGVQLDWRESDQTYDAVWESETHITHDGWVAEIKIPYSALRFARTNPQLWGMQISRSIRRYRETDQWAIESLEAENDLPYWGTLEGIDNIEPPVRLSATPYLILQAEHFPDNASEKDISTSFGGGMDLKYGINESFTLDMSLLPDFSQVQSDNKVKNLTAFETVYDEQRPFFKEAVDLFMKGDIFYSRRIGKTPALFYSVQDSLNDGEYIKKNPVQQRLINATKVSGRNNKGLAIGFLNAVTANTYAVVENEFGDTRKILTDPLTNYNLLVFDQALKNNSDFYFTNTNVIRDNKFRDANVTATGLTLNDKSNTYRINIAGGMSQVFIPGLTPGDKAINSRGFKYDISALKTNGKFQWMISRSAMNDKFDANDMGVTFYNNYNNNSASVSYNIYKPFWILREMNNTVQITNQNNFTTHKPQTAHLEYNIFMTTLNYLTIWGEAGHDYSETYDYYEPRTKGMFYMKPKAVWSNLGFSSDYRKQFALDGSVSIYYSARDDSKGFSPWISPILRVNNHFTFNLSFRYEKLFNDYGFAGNENDMVIFGNRDINTFENSASGKYLIKNNISISIKARHYYSQGQYKSFYTLIDNGYLEPISTYNQNHDFIFNSFNVDMVFSWIFAPGSSLNFVWKNEIINEKDKVSGNYFTNFNDTFQEPNLNNISLKVLYYIDYQRLTSKRNSS